MTALEVFNVTGHLNLSFSNLMALSTLIQVFVVFVTVVQDMFFFFCVALVVLKLTL